MGCLTNVRPAPPTGTLLNSKELDEFSDSWGTKSGSKDSGYTTTPQPLSLVRPFSHIQGPGQTNDDHMEDGA